jgi:sugar lactone lactonase YvrE
MMRSQNANEAKKRPAHPSFQSLIPGAKRVFTAASILIICAVKMASQSPKSSPPTLTIAYRLQDVVNGVTTTRDGRVFVLYPHLDGAAGIRIAELSPDGAPHPYPDEAWNNWKAGDDPTKAFLGTNSLRIGPDERLWVVDTGTRGFGTKIVPKGVKLVAIDVKTDAVDRVYPLQSVVSAESYVDDVRFNGDRAYLTDAGVPGIIVLDLRSGAARRVLDHDPSTTAQRPLLASGATLMANGKELRVNADQLEISPDRKWFYYQPACGPMYRIETRYLDDPGISAEELSRHAKLWLDTPSTGGTAMDAKGNIYLSDVNTRTILKISPSGAKQILLQDERLDWVDAMWIDDSGRLWMPVAQLDQLPMFHENKTNIHLPIIIYTLQLRAAPE